MKVFIDGRTQNNTPEKEIETNTRLINEAFKKYGKNIEIIRPYEDGYYPGGVNHRIYALGKSVERLASCQHAMFLSWTIASDESTLLAGIWEDWRRDK